MSSTVVLSVLLLAPLIGFLINGLRFRKTSYQIAGGIGCLAAIVSFLCSMVLVIRLEHFEAQFRIIQVKLFDWISVGPTEIAASFVVDPVSAIMLLIITGVGSLIHIFSVGYMSHDDRPSKYFAFLNLFLFNMLLLVLGGNLLIMFIGWEGVGLCSYLLIGFWFKDVDKANAGMKAFITNRIGDAGFLLGVFLLFLHFGTLEFAELNKMVLTPEMGWTGPITLASLFLFIGATGKSAQIPLYVWLPDAMAGPTPVSALIHAATMVTAGVYMIVRMHPIFLAAPNAMLVIAIVGGLTALLAASIGTTQFDIKKVLAYSTVSQLGYMFLAVGVGAFGAGLFHLMTHAFFKALLFLGSGAVIHALEGEQDIRKMGGLKKSIPLTHLTFFIGWLAIIGAPPLAGFFSKDEILWQAFSSQRGHWAFWLVGVFGAALTAFYMTRLMVLVFWGKSRVAPEIHPHEVSMSMAIPLSLLAILSVVGGWIGIPHIIGGILPGHIPNFLEHWLAPAISSGVGTQQHSASLEWILMLGSLSIAMLSAAAAYYCYQVRPDIPKRIAEKCQKTYSLVSNKYLVDELYQNMIIKPIVDGSRNLWLHIDVGLVDKVSYFLSDLFVESSWGVRSFQNGNIQRYAFCITVGVVFVLTLVLCLGR